MKQSINRNIFWSQIFADRLLKAKIKNIVVSPGSRSTPLIFALAEQKEFNIKVIIDERTSGFFALGLSKFSDTPTVIVTTSGTAVAELYPAIVEAYQQRIPLIICTADRPKYLNNTGANQTINQLNIYKNHIRKFYNAGLPSIKPTRLENYCSKIDEVILVSQFSNPGPVHINFPFEKPFEPDAVTDFVSKNTIKNIFTIKQNSIKSFNSEDDLPIEFIQKLKKYKDGIIICGNGRFENAFAKKIIRLTNTLHYPIIADGTSPLRYGKHNKKNIITNSTAFLRNNKNAKSLNPKIILQFGKAPTSNTLLQFFNNSSAEKYAVNEYGELHDPSRTVKQVLKLQPMEFIDKLLSHNFDRENSKISLLKRYQYFEKYSEEVKSTIIYNAVFPFEGRIIYEIINAIPDNSNLIISNSTSVRDLDFFSPVSRKDISVFTNRGASGIDGLISTALGIADESKKSTYLIIGDLAFYHDLNSLHIAKKYDIPLKIILVDNNGGGIFNMLPVSNYENVFNKYFRTELNIDFKPLVKGFGGNYSLIKSWNGLNLQISKSIQDTNFSVLHIKTNSDKSVAVRKKYWSFVDAENEYTQKERQ